jgi:hypothetical protein
MLGRQGPGNHAADLCVHIVRRPLLEQLGPFALFAGKDVGMTSGTSTGTDREDQEPGLGTWSFERLHAMAVNEHGRHLEAVRIVAQGRAYDDDRPAEARLRWAKLSLLANRRAHGDGLEERTRAATQDFTLRMWIIDHLGPDDDDPDRSPDALASDTLGTLRLTPSQAGALGDRWRELPIEQIRELRRHKNLTAHLADLVGRTGPGPTRDLLLAWDGVRHRLP